ncbi:MAG: Nif3-like dinuclear metal center hexameric protein [Bacillota bacterium]|nr:Nif3-like dinuclear metal center hexameric protein [Bacillota bacterium]
MSLKVRDIEEIMEQYAPSKLKESYDNVGLMVGDFDSEITSILVALDCTLEVIQEAKDKGCNLIFTHHPMLFRKPSSITTSTLTGKKIIELIKGGINVYSSHTNLDSVKGGIGDLITIILGFNEWSIIEPSAVLGYDDNKTGIGRVVVFDEPIALVDLCQKVKDALKVPYVRSVGHDNLQISKVAIINGSGQDYFEASRKMGVDCIITGDTTYHFASDFEEYGIGIIDAGHFSTEWPAFKLAAKKLQDEINKLGYNNSVILSNCSNDPYTFR